MRKKLILSTIIMFVCLIFFFTNDTAYANNEAKVYYNPTSISIYNNNVYILDSGNDGNGHFLFNATTNTQIGSYGLEANNLNSPTVFAINNEHAFIYNNNIEFKQFKLNGEYVTTHYRYYDGNNEFVPSSILFSFNDTNNNIYFVSSNNDVITYKNNRMELAFKLPTTISINQDSQVVCDLLNNLYIINQANITKYNMETNNIQEYNNDNPYTNVDVDYKGNLYLQNGTDITKINLQTNEKTTTTCSEYVDFCIDKVNGNIYYISLDNTVEQELLMLNDTTFVDNLNEFQKPDDYLTATMLDAPAQIYTVTNNTTAYEYPYYINQLATLQQGDKVLVIGQSENFKYCIITSSKIGNIVCYIKNSDLQLCNYPIVNKQMRIITQNPIIYKYPTSLGYGTLSPITIQIELNYNQNVIVTREINDLEDGSGRAFYEIKLNDKYCYINVSNIGTSLPSAQTSGIKMNATRHSTDELELIPVYNDNDEQIDTILVNTRVRVEHFDKKINKTYITYVVDNEIKTGYVDTKYISIDGLKIEIIIAIVMTIIALVIAIILIYNKKKNV